jgi:hypothetical protein
MCNNKAQPTCVTTKYNQHAAYVPPPLPRACDETRRSRSSCSAANLSCKICCRYTGFFMRRISKTCSLRCRSQTKFAWRPHRKDRSDRSENVSHTCNNKKRTKNEQTRTKTYLSFWQHSDGKIPKNLGLCGFRFWPNAPRVVFWFVVGDPCVVLLCPRIKYTRGKEKIQEGIKKLQKKKK